MTDGYPTDQNLTKRVLNDLATLGIEAYRIGLLSDSIREFLPQKSRVISEMKDLAPAMFELLGRTLAGKLES